MSTTQKLLKNTVTLMIAYGIQPFISFYLIIAISRYMGVGGLGEYRTIFNYVAVFQIVAAFGLKNLLTREIARQRQSAQGLLAAASVIALFFAFISSGLMIATAMVLSSEPAVHQGVYLASISLFAAALADAYEGVMAGFEDLSWIGYAWIVENVMRVVVSLYLLYNGYGIIALVVVYVLARVAKTLFYAYYVSRRWVRPVSRVSWEQIHKLVGQARTFALIMVCVTVYWKADVIMLESMRSRDEVGFYSAAYSFLLISIILIDSFVNSLYPLLANFYENNRERFDLAFKKSLKLVVIVTLPLAITVSLQAREVIFLTFGQSYSASMPALKILIWTILPYSISQVFAYALVASMNQKLDLIVNFVAMLTNIILNLILIPRYGFMGASIATLISIVVYVAVQIPFIQRKIMRLELPLILDNLWRVAVPAIVLALLLFLDPFDQAVISTVMGLIFYFWLLWALRVVSAPELKSVLQSVPVIRNRWLQVQQEE